MTDNPSTDGLILRKPECHCFGCGQFAGGLKEDDPAGDLRERGWERRRRRWHCSTCVSQGF